MKTFCVVSKATDSSTTGRSVFATGRVRGERCGALAWPVEPVSLLGCIDHVARELLAKQIEVDSANGVAVGVDGLGDDVREQLGDLAAIARCHIG